VLDQLRAAADALNRGDPEPFVSLIADENEWRGVGRGFLWWKDVPVCHGPDGARGALSVALKKRDRLEFVRDVQFTPVGDRVIGSAEWIGPDGKRHRRYQVLTFRDGKIVDMQGCSSRREAERFARKA
jgi:ketosteroid isomerase-like protein